MFLQYTINRLGYTLNKVSLFILSFCFLLAISSISYAETKDDVSIQEEKVRKAVINQLFLSNGKSKKKEENTEDVVEVEKAKIVEKKESVVKAEKAKIVEKKEPVVKVEKAKIVEKKEPVVKAEKAKIVEKKEPVVKAEKAKVVEKKEKVVKAEKTKVVEKKEKVVKTEKAKISEKTKEVVKAEQSIPAIESLTKEEVRKLMLDVMKSPDPSSSTKAGTVLSTQSQSKQDKKKTTIANKTTKNKADDKKSPDTTKKTASSLVPVGREQLGRNTSLEKRTGWIYLGRFKSKKWESETLNVENELPKVGKQYAIKATMVNVRETLPKKGKMGKAVKLLKRKAAVEILQLRGLGRNREHYWAKIEY